MDTDEDFTDVEPVCNESEHARSPKAATLTVCALHDALP